MKPLIRIGALVAAALAAGCATQPFAIIDGRNYDRVTLNKHQVVVTAVDGHYFRTVPRYVDPGDHVVRVRSLQPAFLSSGREYVDFKLKTEPCKRYYLAAQHKGPLDPHFEVVVDEVEPIAGCNATG